MLVMFADCGWGWGCRTHARDQDAYAVQCSCVLFSLFYCSLNVCNDEIRSLFRLDLRSGHVRRSVNDRDVMKWDRFLFLSPSDCIYSFTDPSFPSFPLPPAQPNRLGNVQLNKKNPIRFANGSSIAAGQGCSSRSTDHLNWWSSNNEGKSEDVVLSKKLLVLSHSLNNRSYQSLTGLKDCQVWNIDSDARWKEPNLGTSPLNNNVIVDWKNIDKLLFNRWIDRCVRVNQHKTVVLLVDDGSRKIDLFSNIEQMQWFIRSILSEEEIFSSRCIRFPMDFIEDAQHFTFELFPFLLPVTIKPELKTTTEIEWFELHDCNQSIVAILDDNQNSNTSCLSLSTRVEITSIELFSEISCINIVWTG